MDNYFDRLTAVKNFRHKYHIENREKLLIFQSHIWLIYRLTATIIETVKLRFSWNLTAVRFSFSRIL